MVKKKKHEYMNRRRKKRKRRRKKRTKENKKNLGENVGRLCNRVRTQKFVIGPNNGKTKR